MMQTIQNLTKKEKGFTLIELMIVVAIIGILAAIAIPQFSAFKEKAQNAKGISDLGSITTAEEVKYNEDDTYDAVTAAGSSTGNTTTITGATSSTTLVGANASKNTYYVVYGGSATGTNAGIKSSYAAYAGNSKGNRTYGADQTGVRQYAVITVTSSTALPASSNNDMSTWGKNAM